MISIYPLETYPVIRRMAAIDKSRGIINALRLQISLKKELLNPSRRRQSAEYYGILLKYLDDNIPNLEMAASEEERSTLHQYQEDIKRLLADVDTQSDLHEYNPLITPSAATTRDSDLLPISNAPNVRKRVQQHSAEETTSAESIQTLLLQQKDMSALELEDERRSQAALMGELSELSSVLKENTLEMHQAVREQNKQLDSIHKHAEQNVLELDDQKKKLSKQQKSQVYGFWGIVWILITVLLSFAGTYIVMRIFPNPK